MEPEGGREGEEEGGRGEEGGGKQSVRESGIRDRENGEEGQEEVRGSINTHTPLPDHPVTTPSLG